MSKDASPPSDEGESAVILDVLPHGRTEDDRPQYQKQPLAYALGTNDFSLYELVISDDAELSIGDRIEIPGSPAVERRNEVEHGELSSGARAELEYTVEDLVEANEQRFVDFYNEAQPITLRLHQLNLLPGIGKKLRNAILDERDRRPFEGFDDLEGRVSGLHNPEEVLVERIIEELKEDDLKYRTFVGHDPEQ